MDASDDFTHEPGSEPHFNESMYFQFHDPVRRIGGFLRLANRPNEGRGERTVCLFLPGGRLAFGFARPEVTGNERLSAAGLTVTVRRPFELIDVEYHGTVHVLDDPTELSDPRRALSRSPEVECRVALSLTAAAPPHAQTFEGSGGSFAPHHYEQLMTARGTVVVGETRDEVRGRGLRDHSWGPRSWQAPWFYRWLHGSGDGFGFMAAYFGQPSGPPITGGFVWDGSRLHPCDTVRLTTDRDHAHHQVTSTVRIAAGAREWTFHGRVERSVPLRNRRLKGPDDWAETRIVEGATVWTDDHGRVLHGMTEYLDQIDEGLPVGLAV